MPSRTENTNRDSPPGARCRSRIRTRCCFPTPAYTKLDLVRYYLAVADGALRGRGRPAQRARPLSQRHRRASSSTRSARRQSRPPWIEVVALQFPSGRTAEEVVPRDAAALAWMANLACLELHPHPVRADDLDHPDELRVDLDPVPGVGGRRSARSRGVVRATLDDFGLVGLAEDVGLARHARLRAHRAALDVRRGPPRRARVRARGRAARARARHEQVVEGGAPRRVPRLQPEREGSHRSRRVLGAADAGRARVGAARLGRESTTCEPARLHAARRCRRASPTIGDRHAGIDAHAVLARGAARAVGAPRARRAGRRAVAAALPEAGGRAGARAAVAPADVRSIR